MFSPILKTVDDDFCRVYVCPTGNRCFVLLLDEIVTPVDKLLKSNYAATFYSNVSLKLKHYYKLFFDFCCTFLNYRRKRVYVHNIRSRQSDDITLTLLILLTAVIDIFTLNLNYSSCNSEISFEINILCSYTDL